MTQLDSPPIPGGHLLHNLLLFGRLCRFLGIDVTPFRMLEVARALEYLDLGQKIDVYHAMRALMVTRRGDLERFDEAFALFWTRPLDDWPTLESPPADAAQRRRKPQIVPQAGADPDAGGSRAEVDPSLLAVLPTYSQQELLRYKDFAAMNAAELRQAQQMLDQLPRLLPLRRTRRFQSGKGRQLDLRRMLRRSLRHAGETFDLPTRAPASKPRPIVLICDISGSMERYTRIFLHFVHTVASAHQRVESFVFSTQLTHITRQIRQKSVDTALAEVGLRVRDWGGGTRIGEALRAFNYRWSRRVLGQGAIVLIITDGWDRGDPDLLRHEMDRLSRSCHRLIWLNPLLAAPRYEPLTRGAQAMLPSVDEFLPLSTVANMAAILTALGRIRW